MKLNCEGCAGCCLDWRPTTDRDLDHERSGPRPPLDDAYNLVRLSGDEVRGFVDDGLGDALTPRLFRSDAGDDAVEIDGHELAAIDGRPVFYVGLRNVPKPVGPFGRERTWLETCAFLDPTTLQCRIHGGERYPEACATYPGENLRLDRETECERVEAVHGGRRLLESTPPADAEPVLGPGALGATVFAHPEPGELPGTVARAAAGELTPADRASFVGVAVGSSPGSLAVDADRAAEAAERVRATDSWVGRVATAWADRAGEPGEPAAETAPDGELETDRGAPGTPGW